MLNIDKIRSLEYSIGQTDIEIAEHVKSEDDRKYLEAHRLVMLKELAKATGFRIRRKRSK